MLIYEGVAFRQPLIQLAEKPCEKHSKINIDYGLLMLTMFFRHQINGEPIYSTLHHSLHSICALDE